MANVKRISEICDGFNGLLKGIVNDLVDAFPGDPQLLRVKKGLGLLSDVTPIQSMVKTGEHLYKYREAIMDDSEADNTFFNDHDFSDDVGKINDKDEAEMTGYALQKMKEHAPNVSDEKMSKYQEDLRDMLDYYLEYLELK